MTIKMIITHENVPCESKISYDRENAAITIEFAPSQFLLGGKFVIIGVEAIKFMNKLLEGHTFGVVTSSGSGAGIIIDENRVHIDFGSKRRYASFRYSDLCDFVHACKKLK